MSFVKFKSQHISVFQGLRHILLKTSYTGANKTQNGCCSSPNVVYAQPSMYVHQFVLMLDQRRGRWANIKTTFAVGCRH